MIYGLKKPSRTKEYRMILRQLDMGNQERDFFNLPFPLSRDQDQSHIFVIRDRLSTDRL
jgi:hypothetical protein